MKSHATSNALNILGDVCMAGGSSLICSYFSQRVENFLQAIIGKSQSCPRFEMCLDSDNFVWIQDNKHACCLDQGQ